MTHIVKYSVNLASSAPVDGFVNHKQFSHKDFIEKIKKVKFYEDVIKVAAEYMASFKDYDIKKRVKIIDAILEEMNNEDMFEMIPVTTKGLFFFEDSYMDLREIIVKHFINDEDKEQITNLMNQLEEIDEEDITVENLQKKSEIKEKISECEVNINNRVSETMNDNFQTSNEEIKYH